MQTEWCRRRLGTPSASPVSSNGSALATNSVRRVGCARWRAPRVPSARPTCVARASDPKIIASVCLRSRARGKRSLAICGATRRALEPLSRARQGKRLSSVSGFGAMMRKVVGTPKNAAKRAQTDAVAPARIPYVDWAGWYCLSRARFRRRFWRRRVQGVGDVQKGRRWSGVGRFGHMASSRAHTRGSEAAITTSAIRMVLAWPE